MMTSPYLVREADRLHIVYPLRPSHREAEKAKAPAELSPAERATGTSPSSAPHEGEAGPRLVSPTLRPKVMLSSQADLRPQHYRFSRTQSDPAPLEKSAPLQSGAAKALRIAFIALVFAALWAASSGLAWLITRGG